MEGEGEVEVFRVDFRSALFLLVEDLEVCGCLFLSKKAGDLEVERFTGGGGQVGGLERVKDPDGFL